MVRKCFPSFTLSLGGSKQRSRSKRTGAGMGARRRRSQGRWRAAPGWDEPERNGTSRTTSSAGAINEPLPWPSVCMRCDGLSGWSTVVKGTFVTSGLTLISFHQCHWMLLKRMLYEKGISAPGNHRASGNFESRGRSSVVDNQG